jgi:hypothetical protein
MAAKEFESFVLLYLFGIERDFEFLNLFGNVNELFELIDVFNGLGEEFVVTLEE